MAISVLSQASALNPGAELWIMADASNSRWTLKVDWYLNFQVTKSSRHQTANIDSYLRDVIEATELDQQKIAISSNDPLLIPCENLLPCRWAAMIPLHQSYAAWVHEIAKVWKSLGHPALRIFLPAGQNAGSFNELWQTHHKGEDFTVVLD